MGSSLLLVSSLLLIFSSFSLSPASAASQSHPTGPSSPQPGAVLLPVSKDRATNQYVTRLKIAGAPFRLVVDLGQRSAWVPCKGPVYFLPSPNFRPVRCNTSVCRPADNFDCSKCALFGRNYSRCCRLLADNEFESSGSYGSHGEVVEDTLSLLATDGARPGNPVTVPRFAFACPSERPEFLENLASGTSGMLGLGRAFAGAPSQLSSALGFPNKFALCLPSSSASSDGVIFLGDLAAYHFPPSTVVRPSSMLATAPLAFNPTCTAKSCDVQIDTEPSSDYFINVTGIKVASEKLPIDPSILVINDVTGNGGTKLSTVKLYTVMDSSIYKPFAQAFTAHGKFKKVAPVAPFSTCYDTDSVKKAAAVPVVEILLQGSSTPWRLPAPNTLVQVNPKVSCLAFVDRYTAYAIIIGGYQMENHLVLVDMVAETVRISNGPVPCSSFNFTAAK